MDFPHDERFRRESEKFRLHWNCEDCAFFDAEREACSHGYPAGRHRRARYADPEATLLFCKEFTLF